MVGGRRRHRSRRRAPHFRWQSSSGPFYIEGALPGDTLIVHFNRIRLNRDTAISSPLIVNGALDPVYMEQRKPVPDYNSDWKLDREAGSRHWKSRRKP